MGFVVAPLVERNICEFAGSPRRRTSSVKRSEAPALSLPDPEIERGVRWFSSRGCVTEREDGVRDVWLGGTLLASLDEDDVASRAVVLVFLSEDSKTHLGRLAEAFQLSSERVRQLRCTYESEGLEGITRVLSPGRSSSKLSVAANESERESLHRFFADLDRQRLTLPGDPSGRPLRFRAQIN